MVTCLSCNLNLLETAFNYRRTGFGSRKYAFWCTSCRSSPSLWQRANHLVHTVPEVQEAVIREILRRAQQNVRGHPFSLVVENLRPLPRCCPVFGMELNYRPRMWAIMKEVKQPCPQTENAPSIDRIDNIQGYVSGNIVIVSNKANTLKNTTSLTEMKQLVAFYESLT